MNGLGNIGYESKFTKKYIPLTIYIIQLLLMTMWKWVSIIISDRFVILLVVLKIGSNNRFEAFCSIGTRPEHEKHFGIKMEELMLGDNDGTFREYITIHSGTNDKIDIL